ncbi:polysialyltransferase family glycosyltransferase [Exiguobacterium artemiae]
MKNVDINVLMDDYIEKSIVFTQPLSEDGFESEKNKIEIYNNMIKMEVLNDSLIFFKKHPRDETNYKFLNEKNNVIILDSKFPSEIFLFFKIEFKVSLGLCTSAVENINAEIKCNTSPNYFVTKHKNKKTKKGFF